MAKIYSLHGWICGPTIYEYDGWLFEFNHYSGPWPLKKDLSPRKRAGKKFWSMFSQFHELSDDEQFSCKVGGGCKRF